MSNSKFSHFEKILGDNPEQELPAELEDKVDRARGKLLVNPYADPRPDLDRLHHDGERWRRLFRIVLEIDSSTEMYGALHAARCYGAVIARTRYKPYFMLQPKAWGIHTPKQADEEVPEENLADWHDYANNYLQPWRTTIVQALEALDASFRR